MKTNLILESIFFFFVSSEIAPKKKHPVTNSLPIKLDFFFVIQSIECLQCFVTFVKKLIKCYFFITFYTIRLFTSLSK